MSRMILLLAASALFFLGLVMIFSTSSADILDHDLDKSTHNALFKQLMFAIGGLVLGFAIIKIGYRSILFYSGPLLFVFTLLLVMTLIPGIGKEVNGSKRWLSVAGFSFQPSEFVKYLIPAFFIEKILSLSCDLNFKLFLKIIATISVPMFLIMIEPNNGTTATIAVAVLALCFLMRIPFKYWAWPLIAATLVGGTFASQLPYVRARLKVYLDPTLDLKGKGHQPFQAKIAAGSGRFLGKGPGNSLQKLSYLPEAQNDYIAAIYAEEFGFIGIILLITLYVTIATSGFYIAFTSGCKSGFYFAASIAFLFSFQAFLNLGVVSNLLPSTGLNLPLFSQGGSSLMANIMGISLLVSVLKPIQLSVNNRYIGVKSP